MIFDNKIIVLDGAIGTVLQSLGLLNAGEIPEVLNITHKEQIINIHKDYIKSGADIIYANTFGANSYKIPSQYSLKDIITNAITNAKVATKGSDTLVALDVGPIGELLEPLGKLTFEQAYEIFKEIMIIGYNAGADLIVIETISDLYEMKAAVLAAKENTPLPIFATMTFEKTGRSFVGTPVKAMVTLLEGLGVDALGVNCSLTPSELYDIVDTLTNYSSLPIIVKANAGLPNSDGTFNTSSEEFYSHIQAFTKKGVNIIGGCCGTNPQYIKELSKLKGTNYKPRKIKQKNAICTGTSNVELDGIHIVGERLNPTGKKILKTALIEKNYAYVIEQALEQIEAGATILDLNTGLAEINEVEILPMLIKKLQAIINVPLQIDSSNPDAIEQALRVYNGITIVNSVNGDDAVLDKILPICKKYGAMVIGLTLDENGIPTSTKQRIDIAHKIISRCESIGIMKEKIIIDCLTLTASAEQSQVMQTLDAIRYINDELNIKTTLGVSNISFGLPMRELLNSTFLASALSYGLKLPIINPNVESMANTVFSYRALNGDDKNCLEYVEKYKNYSPNTVSKNTKTLDASIINEGIEKAIYKGMQDECITLTKNLLTTNSPLDIANKYIIPALDKVGIDYEKGILFLPQLILASETAKVAFNILNEQMSTTTTNKKATVILATVKGDVHDIGKNIVKVVLENYGYNVIDLGKDVSTENVIEAINIHNPLVVGLSALMTTTAINMKDTVQEILALKSNVKIMIGGAVITKLFQEQIGAHHYSKDALDAVNYLNSLTE